MIARSPLVEGIEASVVIPFGGHAARAGSGNPLLWYNARRLAPGFRFHLLFLAPFGRTWKTGVVDALTR